MTTELPLTLVRRVSRRLAAARAITSSPFSGTQQVQDWGGRWWEYEIEFAVTQGASARRLSVFLDALAGGVGTFLLRDPSIQNPSGLGTPLVNGAGQTGTSLVTDGWSATGLRAGDFFTLGTGAFTRLHRVTADVAPSGGAATVQLFDSAVLSNEASTGSGGAITVTGHSSMRLFNCTLAQNWARINGGAVNVRGKADVSIVNVSIHFNFAETFISFPPSRSPVPSAQQRYLVALLEGLPVAAGVAGFHESDQLCPASLRPWNGPGASRGGL